jgi:immunity protein 26 of polymorphic toxin system
MVATNLIRLRPSRKPLKAGDVFSMRLIDEKYLFGRVIEAEIPSERAPTPAANLVYLYRSRTIAPDYSEADLSPGNLLLPPVFTNRLAWSHGYFETIHHQPLRPEDLLPAHCFRDWRGQCRDRDGQVLPRVIEPCGSWSLASYRGLEDKICDALGIPRAP